MAYGTLQTDVLNTSTGVFSTNNAYSGIANCWAYFTYISSTLVTVASYNVSSILEVAQVNM